jgi:hypothetical protein
MPVVSTMFYAWGGLNFKFVKVHQNKKIIWVEFKSEEPWHVLLLNKRTCRILLCGFIQNHVGPKNMCKKTRKTCIRQNLIEPSPLQKFLIVEGLVLAIMVPLHLPKHAFVPQQLVHLHGFYMGGIKNYDT